MTTLHSSPHVGPHRRSNAAILVAALIAVVLAVVLVLSLAFSGVSHGRPTPRAQPSVSYSTAGHQGIASPRDRGQGGSGTQTMLPSAQPARCRTADCRNRR